MSSTASTLHHLRLTGAAAAVTAGLLLSLPAGAFASEVSLHDLTAAAVGASAAAEGASPAAGGSTVAGSVDEGAKGDGSSTLTAGKDTALVPGASDGAVAVVAGETGSAVEPGEGSSATGSTDASGEGSGSSAAPSPDEGAGESAGAPSKGDGTSEGNGAEAGESSTDSSDVTDGEQAKEDDPQEGTSADKAAQAEPSDEQTEELSAGEAAAPRQDAPAAAGWDASGTRFADAFTREDGTVWYEWRTGWLVDAMRGQGLQRYWFDSEGNLVSGRLIDPGADGSGYFAYARPDGVIVRGWYDAGDGRFYYADNDGRLWSEGWHVDNVGQGLQRYYVESGSHAMVAGAHTTSDGRADWWAHYTTSKGYVARSATTEGGVAKVIANNDGKLTQKGGWVVTSAFGQGLQRYWFSDYQVAANRLVRASEAGWNAYATSAGYVLRGFTKTAGGNVYYADNDGKLWSAGWHVANIGQGLQRYYVETDTLAMTPGLHKVADGLGGWYAHYTTADGYVLRGKLDNGAGRVYLANNDGALVNRAADGWFVTDIYDGGYLQRYWIVASEYAAVSGFFKDGAGSSYFGLGGAGYVLRGKATWGSHMLLADNDGRLAALANGSTAGWIVTGAYDGGTLQRYYLDAAYGTDYLGAKLGEFQVGEDRYYGREDTGYVVRGSWRNANGVLFIADNEGKLYFNLNGIDISRWQNGIDLSLVPADFVIIKATQGNWYTNSTYAQYADQALALGKKLGFYHFIEATSSPEEQADYFINAVGKYIGQAALFLDWEDTTGQASVAQGPDFAKRFLDRVYEKTGVRALIYMSRSVVHSYNWNTVANSGYKLWLAQYPYKYYGNGTGHVTNPDKIAYGTHSSTDYGAWGQSPTIWQYTSTGRVNGWNDDLDLNVFYGRLSDWDSLAAVKRA